MHHEIPAQVWSNLSPEQREVVLRLQVAYAAMDRACNWTIDQNGVLRLSHCDCNAAPGNAKKEVDFLVSEWLTSLETSTKSAPQDVTTHAKLQFVTALVGDDPVFACRAIRRILGEVRIAGDKPTDAEHDVAFNVINDLTLVLGMLIERESVGLAFEETFVESFRNSVSAARRVLLGEFRKYDYGIALVDSDLIGQVESCIDEWHEQYRNSAEANEAQSDGSVEPIENPATAILSSAFSQLTAIFGRAPTLEAVRVALAAPYGPAERTKTFGETRRDDAIVELMKSVGIAVSKAGLGDRKRGRRDRR